jgi:predicted HicB family RNase H-like nuclease
MRIRMPRALHRWLVETAKRQHRSLNAQIRHTIQQAAEAEKDEATA